MKGSVRVCGYFYRSFYMAQATISARIDSKDKKDFDKFCNSVGLSVSSALTLFIKTVIRQKRIPFAIDSKDPFYSKSNVDFLKEGIAELNAGKGVEKTMEELESMEND